MARLEVWTTRGRDDIVTLTETRYLIGSDAASAQIVLDDPAVSGVHARLDLIGSTWLVDDVGSLNGTLVGGTRIAGQRRLRDGEQINLGRCRLVFRDSDAARRPRTDALAERPDDITPRQRLVLVELCRPILSHNAFQPPASVQEIADRMYVTKNAVQGHLIELYGKFRIHAEDGGNRRVALANAAIQTGTVTLRDLEERDVGDDGSG